MKERPSSGSGQHVKPFALPRPPLQWAVRVIEAAAKGPADEQNEVRWSPWFLHSSALFFVGLIALYKSCVPRRSKATCRFTPSCSTYMVLAIKKYGPRLGVRKGAQRISKCLGFVPGGEDWP